MVGILCFLYPQKNFCRLSISQNNKSWYSFYGVTDYLHLFYSKLYSNIIHVFSNWSREHLVKKIYYIGDGDITLYTSTTIKRAAQRKSWDENQNRGSCRSMTICRSGSKKSSQQILIFIFIWNIKINHQIYR